MASIIQPPQFSDGDGSFAHALVGTKTSKGLCRILTEQEMGGLLRELGRLITPGPTQDVNRNILAESILSSLPCGFVALALDGDDGTTAISIFGHVADEEPFETIWDFSIHLKALYMHGRSVQAECGCTGCEELRKLWKRDLAFQELAGALPSGTQSLGVCPGDIVWARARLLGDSYEILGKVKVDEVEPPATHEFPCRVNRTAASDTKWVDIVPLGSYRAKTVLGHTLIPHLAYSPPDDSDIQHGALAHAWGLAREVSSLVLPILPTSYRTRAAEIFESQHYIGQESRLGVARAVTYDALFLGGEVLMVGCFVRLKQEGELLHLHRIITKTDGWDFDHPENDLFELYGRRVMVTIVGDQKKFCVGRMCCVDLTDVSGRMPRKFFLAATQLDVSKFRPVGPTRLDILAVALGLQSQRKLILRKLHSWAYYGVQTEQKPKFPPKYLDGVIVPAFLGRGAASPNENATSGEESHGSSSEGERGPSSGAKGKSKRKASDLNVDNGSSSSDPAPKRRQLGPSVEEFEALKAHNSALLARVADYDNLVRSNKATVKELEELKAANSALSAQVVDRGNLIVSNELLTRTIGEDDARLKESEKRVKRLSDENEEMKQRVDQLDKKYTESAAEKTQLQQTVTQLQQTVRDLEEKLAGTEETVQDLLERLT